MKRRVFASIRAKSERDAVEREIQHIAVCCSVLQCVAVCCSVSQSVFDTVSFRRKVCFRIRKQSVSHVFLNTFDTNCTAAKGCGWSRSLENEVRKCSSWCSILSNIVLVKVQLLRPNAVLQASFEREINLVRFLPLPRILQIF